MEIEDLEPLGSVLTRFVHLPSLSFGAGGKNRDTGIVEKGWGYYEVSVQE